uniref:Uncharacterized protein n=1 Tax=Arundo donax TaxID=35708 RepID=A0A0A9EHH5_ARUDO
MRSRHRSTISLPTAGIRAILSTHHQSNKVT